MTALVIGGSGLVGGALIRSLGNDVIGTYRTRPFGPLRYLDAADSLGVQQLVEKVAADVVYFPAANPNVDWCENEPDAAYAANVVPALTALRAARVRGAGFVFFSSDYVFDGAAGPYREDHPVRPLSVYGRHKREVEDQVLAAGGTVVRTTTVFGQEPPPGKNFVLRLTARLRNGEEVTVPNDQFSTPTWSDELARGASLVGARPGIWHVAGPDLLSRDQFATLVADVFGLDASLIRPVPTSALRQSAPRPMRAGLKTEKIQAEFGVRFLTTREALTRLMMAL